MTGARIVVDTREKEPYNFQVPGDVIHEGLDVGDYSIEGSADIFVVERKSLNDLATSLGAERDRFEAEIQRAQALDEFAVVIEAPRSAVADYRDRSECPSYFSSIHPNAVLGTVAKWPERYDVLSFEWCDGRDSAGRETLRLLDQWYLKYSTDLF